MLIILIYEEILLNFKIWNSLENWKSTIRTKLINKIADTKYLLNLQYIIVYKLFITQKDIKTDISQLDKSKLIVNYEKFTDIKSSN